MLKKLSVIIISLFMLFMSTACSGYDNTTINSKLLSGKVDKNYTLSPITSEDDYKLLSNPDRGMYIEVEYDVKKNSTMYTNDNSGPIGDLMYKYELYKNDNPTLARAYIHLNGYKGVDLDKQAIDRINEFFDGFRRLKMKCLLTFVYQYDINGVMVDGELKYVNVQGDGQVDKETMFRHIEQLTPILEANKDVISCLFAGFLGAWGEWALYDGVEFNTATKKVLLEKIIDMTPKELKVLVRYPSIKINLLSKNDPRYQRVGFHCDSIFGYIDASKYGSADWNPGSHSWNLSVAESANIATAGELFWGWWFANRDFELDGLSVISQLYDQRFYAFSMAHSYKEYDLSSSPSKWPLYQWKNQQITENDLQELQINYSDSWFKKANGKKADRTIFEFIRDYTGYKLELRNVGIEGNADKLGTLNIKIDLVNYGFAAPFNMESGIAILDEDGNVYSQTKVGTPREWHNRLANNTEFDLLTHSIETKIKLPVNSGTYSLAFYMNNTMNEFARVGNKIDFINGYNVFAKVKV